MNMQHIYINICIGTENSGIFMGTMMWYKNVLNLVVLNIQDC